MTTTTSAHVQAHDPDRALGRLDRLQPVILIGSIGLGLALVHTALGRADRLLPLVSIGVFVLIYLVMLGVDAAGVATAFSNRRFLTTAAVVNFIVNPLVAWALAATLLGSEPDLRVGLILFLVTPCIGWYLIFTELAGGDARLGVSLLAINVVLQIVLLPLYLSLFAGEALGADLSTIARSIALYLAAPLGLAAATRAVLRHRRISIDDVGRRVRLPHVKTAVLAVVIVAMFAARGDEILEQPGVVAKLVVPIVAFFAIAFGLAIAIGRAMRFPYEHTALLVFTTTSRNSEASLAIAATAFANPLVSLTVVLGPAIELPLLVLMVRALLHLNPRLRPDPTPARTARHATDSEVRS